MARKVGIGCLGLIGLVLIGLVLVLTFIGMLAGSRSGTSAAPPQAAVNSTAGAAAAPTQRPPTVAPMQPPPTRTPVPLTPVPPKPTLVPTADPTLEYKLAVIQNGGYVDASDPVVSQFGEALDELGHKCQEPRNRLSGMAIIVHDDMVKRGVTETYLSILEHVSGSIPDELVAAAGPQKCADIFAAYFVLRVPH